jgi:hypothetical protein
LAAGYDTSHLGVGRCKFHGGSALGGIDNGMYKTGRYAHVFKGRLQQHFENIGNDDSNPLDLVPELQVQRVMLSLALDKLDESPLQPQASQPLQLEESNLSGDGSVSYDVIDNDDSMMVVGGGGSGVGVVMEPLDIPRVEFLDKVDATSSIEVAKDARVVQAKMRLVRTEDVELVRELSSDIVNTVTRIIAARNQTALTKAEIVYLMSTMREAIEKFVPKENREAFVRFIMEKIPIGEKEVIEDG